MLLQVREGHLAIHPYRSAIGLKLPQEHQTLSSPPSSFRFNLKDHNLIGAGQYNGQFTVYDMRKSGNGPAETTPVDVSHRDPVYDLAWLQSKTGTEAMTVSTDGNVGRDGEGTSGALRYWVSAFLSPKLKHICGIILYIRRSLRYPWVGLFFCPKVAFFAFYACRFSGGISASSPSASRACP